MIDTLQYWFQAIPDWVLLTGLVAGIVCGALLSIVGIAENHRRVQLEHRGMYWLLKLLEEFSGMLATVVCWMVGMPIVGILAATLIYLLWSPVTLIILASIALVWVLISRWWRRRQGF